MKYKKYLLTIGGKSVVFRATGMPEATFFGLILANQIDPEGQHERKISTTRQRFKPEKWAALPQ